MTKAGRMMEGDLLMRITPYPNQGEYFGDAEVICEVYLKMNYTYRVDD